MEKQPDLEFQRVLETIRSHFDFLFQRGYRITSAMFTDPCNKNWNVVLAGDNCLIKIRCCNETVHLALNSIQLFGKIGLFDLHELVDLMSGDGSLLHSHRKTVPDETEQLQKTAWLLQEHIDDLLILFQRIHLGLLFSRTGELFKDNSPVFLFNEIDGMTRYSQNNPYNNCQNKLRRTDRFA